MSYEKGELLNGQDHFELVTSTIIYGTTFLSHSGLTLDNDLLLFKCLDDLKSQQVIPFVLPSKSFHLIHTGQQPGTNSIHLFIEQHICLSRKVRVLLPLSCFVSPVGGLQEHPFVSLGQVQMSGVVAPPLGLYASRCSLPTSQPFPPVALNDDTCHPHLLESSPCHKAPPAGLQQHNGRLAKTDGVFCLGLFSSLITTPVSLQKKQNTRLSSALGWRS